MENLIIISNDYQNVRSAVLLGLNAGRQLCAINPGKLLALLRQTGVHKKTCSRHGINCPRFIPASHTQTPQGAPS